MIILAAAGVILRYMIGLISRTQSHNLTRIDQQTVQIQVFEQGGGEYLLPDLIPGATYTVDAERAGDYLGRVTFTAPRPGSTAPAVSTLNGHPPRP